MNKESEYQYVLLLHMIWIFVHSFESEITNLLSESHFFYSGMPCLSLFLYLRFTLKNKLSV